MFAGEWWIAMYLPPGEMIVILISGMKEWVCTYHQIRWHLFWFPYFLSVSLVIFHFQWDDMTMYFLSREMMVFVIWSCDFAVAFECAMWNVFLPFFFVKFRISDIAHQMNLFLLLLLLCKISFDGPKLLDVTFCCFQVREFVMPNAVRWFYHRLSSW